MKIGVALSGCDIGGVGASGVLETLTDQGLHVEMVSASGIPSIPALLYACGLERDTVHRLCVKFAETSTETDMDMAIAELAAVLPLHKLPGGPGEKDDEITPLAINAVNMTDGRICTFTDRYCLCTDRLETFPLTDAYDVLSASISPADGLSSYPYHGRRLCDFSIWYGLPVHPLNMAAVDKVISVAFVPRDPKSPYEVLVKHKLAASSGLPDVHLAIEFDGDRPEPEQYIEIAAEQVKNCIDRIFVKMTF